jgi:hypothetical protein
MQKCAPMQRCECVCARARVCVCVLPILAAKVDAEDIQIFITTYMCTDDRYIHNACINLYDRSCIHRDQLTYAFRFIQIIHKNHTHA